ncbi:MAG: nucleotidyltransferase family protein [Nanoarchaeota archaeon]
MTKRNELKEITEKLIPLLKKHNVTKAGIFGSYARGDQTKKSDVDILIELDNKVSLLGFIRLKNILEDEINKKIDLVEYSLIRKELRNRILNEEIAIIR